MSDLIIGNLCKNFEEKKVLEHFSAVFKEGKITCIMGRSGCGKTTLIRILLGFLEADSGSIEGIPQRMAAVFQEDRLCEPFSALSNVRLVAPQKEEKAKELLRALGLGESMNKKVSDLSGGMRRRVALARALLYDADLLILDEPFKGLDENTRLHTIELLRRETGGKTVLCVTHDVREVLLLEAELFTMPVSTEGPQKNDDFLYSNME